MAMDAGAATARYLEASRPLCICSLYWSSSSAAISCNLCALRVPSHSSISFLDVVVNFTLLAACFRSSRYPHVPQTLGSECPLARLASATLFGSSVRDARRCSCARMFQLHSSCDLSDMPLVCLNCDSFSRPSDDPVQISASSQSTYIGRSSDAWFRISFREPLHGRSCSSKRDLVSVHCGHDLILVDAASPRTRATCSSCQSQTGKRRRTLFLPIVRRASLRTHSAEKRLSSPSWQSSRGVPRRRRTSFARPRVPVFLLFVHFLFFQVSRRRRGGSAPTKAHHQCWNVHGMKQSQHTAEKERNPSF